MATAEKDSSNFEIIKVDFFPDSTLQTSRQTFHAKQGKVKRETLRKSNFISTLRNIVEYL